MNMFLGVFMYALIGIPSPALAVATPVTTPAPTTQTVPFYSQFKDITSSKWQKVGCGVTSLAMIIDYYKPAVPVNTLLTEAIALGAYSKDGWTYAGLIATSKKYGMQGTAYDLGTSDTKSAYAAFSKALASGPVIASVHYKFDPKSTIPHLVVITSVKDGILSYNDPAGKAAGGTISIADFQKAWKKRYIVIRPAPSSKIALK